ncbi:hypothetical protein OROMI_017603 [Orobanche minor]
MWFVKGVITKTIFFFVLLCFLKQGLGLRSNLVCPKINQLQVNSSIVGWEVKIENTCPCTISKIKLSCPNFKPLNDVDPEVISKYDDSHCLVNNGRPLFENRTFNFTYVGDRVKFAIFDYEILCKN